MEKRRITRREFVRLSALTGVGIIAAACQATPAVIEKEVTKEVPVEKTVLVEKEVTKEVEVEKTVLVEKEVTVEVEKVSQRQAPTLQELVKAGKLPPLEERLPPEPLVVQVVERIGTYGGTLRGYHTNPDGCECWMDIGNETVTALDMETGTMPVPSLAKSWEEEDKSVTYHIREGMKWSDGEPYTVDDIMFWWEDLQNNEEMTPAKSKQWMNVEKLDDFTVRITMRVANPAEFLSTQGVVVQWPKHFMKDFHPKYTDQAQIDAQLQQYGFDAWYKLMAMLNDHPSPWVRSPILPEPTMVPYEGVSNHQANLVVQRNPYYWKVDPEGNQLPYLDGGVHTLVQDQEAGKLKIVAGEIDFHIFGLLMADYPLLKQNEAAGNYRTLVWPTIGTGTICLMFNLTNQDPIKREIFRDPRFRRAISLGLDRDEMNKVLCLGQALIQQAVALPGTTWYPGDEYAKMYTAFDGEEANRLLDEMGLDQLDANGYRKRSDGETLTIVFEYWPGEAHQAPSELMGEMIRTNLHINLVTKATERGLQWNRWIANEFDLTCWHIDRQSQIHFPTYCWQVVAYQTAGIAPLWGQWFQDGRSTTGGGEEPIPEYLPMYDWYETMQTGTRQEAIDAAHKLLISECENLWAIGSFGLAPAPLACNNKLRNVPEKCLFGADWNFSTLARIEQFFFEA